MVTIPAEETGAVIPMEQAQAEGITEGQGTETNNEYSNYWDTFDWDAYWANYNWGDYSYNNDEASYDQSGTDYAPQQDEAYAQQEYVESSERPVEVYDQAY